ncbi:MAG: lipoyl synthase [Desulfatiglandaceae bacterium]
MMEPPAQNIPLKKPSWLTKRLSTGRNYDKVVKLLKECRLETVCEQARCPNLGECFARGTATFMILGGLCTRNCRFCAVAHGKPHPPNTEEPEKVAEAVKALGLSYAVVTSVTRDDLPDGGAAHFAKTIVSIKAKNPATRVEVLIPDFRGSTDALKAVTDVSPNVLNHNLETIPRLYQEVRPGADYQRSLALLRSVKSIHPGMITKSGLMLGLGETGSELRTVFNDLREAGCGALTLGQYLAPSRDHHPVLRYVPPDEFFHWEQTAYDMGFKAVAAGPFVRSSFQAEDLFFRVGAA